MSKAIVNNLETKKGVSFAISSKNASELLHDLISAYGYDLLTMTPRDKAEIADRLSRIAGQSPAWTWRYVHNILRHKIDASQRFINAILALGAVQDGANPLMINVRQVQVYAAHVNPGSIILAASRKCANPDCPIEFVPVVPRQRYCSAECRAAGSRAANAKHKRIKK
mgnify:CR=1 FL=1